jgi:phenylpyruvate tautomerase PptA (4-oxalocrotonate tautomerase family)
MPLIEVHLIEKVFNPEQKRQIIQKLTDAMVSIEGENMRGHGDEYHHCQRHLIDGMALYCIASVIAITASSFETLLLARVLQGLGTSATRVIATSIVRDCYAGRTGRRPKRSESGPITNWPTPKPIRNVDSTGVTWVKISEVASGEWGIGGKPLTTEAVKELAAGRRAA